jgi:dihydropteroate synthase
MTINIKGELIDLSKPKIMGILNLTPDSFYDGGKYNKIENALLQTEKMLNAGAYFIDLGAYSSKPGAKTVSVEVEKKRLLPVLEKLIKTYPKTHFSIDTFRSTIAAEGIDRGAAMINDISGGQFDNKMMDTIGYYNVPYILTHTSGKPKIMQKKSSV